MLCMFLTVMGPWTRQRFVDNLAQQPQTARGAQSRGRTDGQKRHATTVSLFTTPVAGNVKVGSGYGEK